MRGLKTIIASIVAGIVITLLTGLVNTTPNVIGAAWYGWPTAWFTVPVVPNPVMSMQWGNFVLDVVFWFIIALIVLYVAERAKGSKAKM